MSRKYKFHDNDKLYFISYVPIAIGIHWIDVYKGRIQPCNYRFLEALPGKEKS